MDEWARFLAARLDEMEAEAKEVRPVWGEGGDPAASIFIQDDDYKHQTLVVDSAYVLADIAAKRKILEVYASPFIDSGSDRSYAAGRVQAVESIIRWLCEPFASHPAYPGERG